MSGRLVRALAGISVAGAAHAALNVALLRRPPADPPPVRRPVTVVLPVRNEREQVGECLAALLDQRGVADLRIVVVDDGSTDGTADAVRAVADPRVRLVDAGPLPPGWLGKAHACATGAASVEQDDGIVAFVDADVRLFPDALAGAVAVLERHHLDLVSPWPRPIAHGLAERLVQPLVPWLWATTLPVRLAERSPRPSTGRGHRPVPRRSPARGYERAGGHAAVRGEVLEDIALLRAVKRSGGRGGPVDGSRLAACRMYEGWPALRDGYAKSLWGAVGGFPGGEFGSRRRADRRLGGPAARRPPRIPGGAPRLRGRRRGPRLSWRPRPAAGSGPTRSPTRCRCWCWTCSWRGRSLGHRRGTLHWRGRALPAPTRRRPATMGA